MKKSFSLYSLIILCTDVLAYYLSLFLAYELRLFAERLPFIGMLEFTFEHFLALWWIPLTFIFFQISGGLYWRRTPFWIESGKVLRSLLLSFMVAFSLVSLGQLNASVSRLLLCMLFALLYPSILILRIIVKRTLYKFTPFQQKAIVIGDPKRLKEIRQAFEESPYMGISVTEEIPLDTGMSKADIGQLIEANEISTAIIAASDKHTEDSDKLFKFIHTKVKNVIYVPVPGAMDMTNAETGQLLQSQLGYLSINRALSMPHNRILKRTMDLLLSVTLLPFVAIFTLLMTIVIRAGSKGAGIFTQERVGLNGKIFKVLKLRTMYSDADKRLQEMIDSDPAIREEWEKEYKLKHDPRITPLGSFLRKSSLDELPQVFNVLKGEMSMVGPRPVLQEELDKYYGEDAVYYKMAPPGITGLWQVSGRNDTSYDERVCMDNWYVSNWSLWLDIVILLSTPLVVILRRGAY